jgi:hypothetical protein
LLHWTSKWQAKTLLRLLHTKILFKINKIKISTFHGISKFLKLIVFRQILTRFCSDGQFWVDLTAMAVADNIPSFERKKKNIITFGERIRISHVMACWKALRISYPPRRFWKIQLQTKIVFAHPNSINSIGGIHSPLWIHTTRSMCYSIPCLPYNINTYW